MGRIFRGRQNQNQGFGQDPYGAPPGPPGADAPPWGAPPPGGTPGAPPGRGPPPSAGRPGEVVPVWNPPVIPALRETFVNLHAIEPTLLL